MHPELINLREQYLKQIRKLIATYPAQAQNERYYLHKVATAQLGRMREGARTKGDHSVFERFDLVLVWPPEWSMATTSTVWHPRNDCPTVVDKYRVEVVGAVS